MSFHIDDIGPPQEIGFPKQLHGFRKMYNYCGAIQHTYVSTIFPGSPLGNPVQNFGFYHHFWVSRKPRNPVISHTAVRFKVALDEWYYPLMTMLVTLAI